MFHVKHHASEGYGSAAGRSVPARDRARCREATCVCGRAEARRTREGRREWSLAGAARGSPVDGRLRGGEGLRSPGPTPAHALWHTRSGRTSGLTSEPSKIRGCPASSGSKIRMWLGNRVARCVGRWYRGDDIVVCHIPAGGTGWSRDSRRFGEVWGAGLLAGRQHRLGSLHGGLFHVKHCYPILRLCRR